VNIQNFEVSIITVYIHNEEEFMPHTVSYIFFFNFMLYIETNWNWAQNVAIEDDNALRFALRKKGEKQRFFESSLVNGCAVAYKFTEDQAQTDCGHKRLNIN
jgi:hypothetical protein